MHVVKLLKVVNPDTFIDDISVVLYVVLVNIALVNTAGNLKDPSVDVQSNLPVRFIETIEFVVQYTNMYIHVCAYLWCLTRSVIRVAAQFRRRSRL